MASKPIEKVKERADEADERPEAADTTQATTMALITQLAEALAKAQGSSLADAIKQTAAANAEAYELAVRKAENRDNPDFPNYSHLNPEGDTARPRDGVLKCDIWHDDVPLAWWQLSHDEIALCNALEPGIYFVRKTDDSEVKVEVHATANPTGVGYTRLNIKTGANDNDKNKNWPPFRQWMAEMQHLPVPPPLPAPPRKGVAGVGGRAGAGAQAWADPHAALQHMTGAERAAVGAVLAQDSVPVPAV